MLLLNVNGYEISFLHRMCRFSVQHVLRTCSGELVPSCTETGRLQHVILLSGQRWSSFLRTPHLTWVEVESPQFTVWPLGIRPCYFGLEVALALEKIKIALLEKTTIMFIIFEWLTEVE